MEPKNHVAEILDTGLTQAQLAEMVPCSQSLISSLLTGARGSNISKRIGDRLEAIHAELCSKPAPRRATDPDPPPGRAGRNLPSAKNIMSAAIDQPVVYERKT